MPYYFPENKRTNLEAALFQVNAIDSDLYSNVYIVYRENDSRMQCKL